MDALVSAVASDLIGRLISFLIGKYQESSAVDTSDDAVRLQRALLRARVVVVEAEGRQIANRAMLQQLNQLKQQLCRATYALDTLRWRDRRSMIRSVSQARTPPSSGYCSDVLLVMVESLEATLSDMTEFVMLLGGCPRVTRQPYSAYLFMEKCMFGRQIEKEEIIRFLLQPANQDLDVLPVIGPQDVGKQTLVEHVCLDERVRERFTKIHRLSINNLDDAFEIEWSLFEFNARSLMVINLIHNDADAEKPWRRFYSALRRRAHVGSKIIVISRTEAVSSQLGTVPPLRLRPPCREELWYFFRTLAFGAVDPDDRPDLASIAMALCEGINGFPLFSAASLIAASLRANLSTRSWRRVLKMYAEAAVLQLGAIGDDEDKAGHSWLSRNPPGAPFLFYNRRKLSCMTRDELPKVTMVELVTGGAPIPAGETRFDVVVWQSCIPPYRSYVATCDIGTARTGKRKRRRSPAHHVPCIIQPPILYPSSWGCVPGSGGLLVFFPC